MELAIGNDDGLSDECDNSPPFGVTVYDVGWDILDELV